MAKLGRPTKYDPKLCKEIIKYFDIEPYREVEMKFEGKDGNPWSKWEDKANDLPTLAGFAAFIKVNKDTLLEWAKNHQEFSVALKRAKELQEHILVTNGLKSLYAPAFAIFTAKNILGWKDRQDITTNDKDIPQPLYGGLAKDSI